MTTTRQIEARETYLIAPNGERVDCLLHQDAIGRYRLVGVGREYATADAIGVGATIDQVAGDACSGGGEWPDFQEGRFDTEPAPRWPNHYLRWTGYDEARAYRFPLEPARPTGFVIRRSQPTAGPADWLVDALDFTNQRTQPTHRCESLSEARDYVERILADRLRGIA